MRSGYIAAMALALSMFVPRYAYAVEEGTHDGRRPSTEPARSSGVEGSRSRTTRRNWGLTVKEVQAPLFVYSKEQNNICVNISNSDRWSTRTAKVTLTLKPKGGKQVKMWRSFDVRNKRDDAVLVPFDMSAFPNREGTMEVLVTEGKEEVYSCSIAVRDSFAGLKGIKVESGSLVDSKGVRQMICTTLEDQAKYRKWAPIKWVAKRVNRSAKKVLVFGSKMVNSPSKAQGPYVDALKKTVEKEEESFTFQARGEGLRPMFEDLLKAEDLVKKHKPDIFVFCPGVGDAYNSVPVRDFTRALDVMIDQVRERKTPPRIILVTPVPMLSDLEFSEELAEAVCEIAKLHHTDVVDLRKVLAKKNESLLKAYGDEESNVFHRYPTVEAQERIAEAIADYIY